MIKALRTPEDRFANLPDFPFGENYLDNLSCYQGLRMHYLDEGPNDAEHTFLCLHGQPTWGFLYRKMIPVFTSHGNRCVAPDFFGFGRSDKPVEESVYQFDFHRGSLIALIERLDLKRITLVCQDWGGIIGLTLPMDMPGRFSRMIVMNTALGTGDVPLTEGFYAWREWVNSKPDMAVGKLMGRSSPHFSEVECKAYDAPFPDVRYKAGLRRFPNLVPDRPDAPGAVTSQRARAWLSTEWQGHAFMAIGMQDPVLGPPVMKALHNVIRNCSDALEIPEAGHFVQEWGGQVAEEALVYFDRCGPVA